MENKLINGIVKGGSMKEISRVESETVNLEGLADKVNEIVDAMNSLLENVRYIRPENK